MTVVARPKPAFWTVERFRDFVETRPDEERWELIDDVALTQAPPLATHQIIASNLENLLNDALEISDPSRMAVQRLGLDLTPEIDTYQPEPDVVVIDAAIELELRYVRRFHLVAEIVLESDRAPLPKGGRTRLGAKLDIYKTHEPCLYVLTIEQSRIGVRVDIRTEASWVGTTLRRADDRLALPAFGFECAVRDLYRRTPLAR
jgi:Uma2 family endonuclease